MAMAMILLAAPSTMWAQTASDDSQQNAKQARTALNAMVLALGGDAWLTMKNQVMQQRVAAYFHGQPSGGAAESWEYHAWPDRDRIEFSRHRDVVQFYLTRVGYEVTFKGKAPLPQEQVDDFLRRRDHSIETAIRLWLNDPKTILIYEGQRMVANRMADQVTLISAGNEAVTILTDAQTHLPLCRTFEWRDPVNKERDVDSEQYDDYHSIDGIPTPFTVSRFKNDDLIRQYLLVHVSYNQELPADIWSVDAAERRIKK
jgi:hypothetical protein